MNAAEELHELRQLFALQQTRMAEATARWRAEDAEARALMLPDLGELLDWLMADADRKHAAGYDRATAALTGVFARSGSPAARWAADFLAADPDRWRHAEHCAHGVECSGAGPLCAPEQPAATPARRNPHCANCGNTRGGPAGHETSECTWDSRGTAEARQAATEAVRQGRIAGGVEADPQPGCCYRIPRALATCRTGAHHGVTIVREGDGARCGRPDHDCDRGHLVAVVVNGDQELAECVSEKLTADPRDCLVCHPALTEFLANGRLVLVNPTPCRCTQEHA